MVKIKELETLRDIITNRCDVYRDRIAFLEKDKITRKFNEITYGKLQSDTIALGTAMIKYLKLEDKKVAVIGENSYKWYVTYMATVCGVGVIVPLDKELPVNEVENLMQRSEAECIVYSTREKEKIESLKPKLNKNVIFIEMDKSNSDDISYSYDEVLKKGYEYLEEKDSTYLDKQLDPNKFVALIFTSGTTSKPKGVMLCHRNFVSNIKVCEKRMPASINVRYFSILPIHHTYEFMINYLNPISKGCSVAICEGLKYFIKDMQETHPDVIVVVPLIVEKVIRAMEKEIIKQGKQKQVQHVEKVANAFSKIGIDFRRKVFKEVIDNFGGKLKYIFCGGAPLSLEMIAKVKSFGFIFVQGYGLTEAAPLVSTASPKDQAPGTVGKPIPGCDVRIDLEENQTEGEIIVKGPNVMLGYYKNEEETQKVLRKGWLYTGDIGHFDNKGNLVISGRSKNVIVTQNGKKIFPEELEFLINQTPLVNESLVYGKPDKDQKNELILTARVTLDEEYIKDTYGAQRPSDEQLYNMIWQDIKNINHSLVSYKSIKILEIKKEDFIKTTTLKIKRDEELKSSADITKDSFK